MAVVVLLLAAHVQAALPELIPKDCPSPKNMVDAMAAYAHVSEKKFDANSLTCAATIIAQAADRKPDDVELNATALGAQMELLDILSSI